MPDWRSWLGFEPKRSSRGVRVGLPAVHSFVECTVRDGPRGQVCIESIGPQGIVITALSGMRVGATATLSYQTSTGRFAFSVPILSVGSNGATIQRPAEIRTLDSYLGARQRAGVRVQLTLAVRWRFMGNGLVGEYRAGTVNDLSRNGMQMTSDFALTIGDQIDVGLPVRKDGSVVTVIGVVRRVEKLSSGKTLAGVELLRVAPNLEAEIVGFLNRRQIDLRKRGLA